jgi:hypothetical protein
MAINAHFYKKLGYDAARDFDPIALLARVGFVPRDKVRLACKKRRGIRCALRGVTRQDHGLRAVSDLTPAGRYSNHLVSFVNDIQKTGSGGG